MHTENLICMQNEISCKRMWCVAFSISILSIEGDEQHLDCEKMNNFWKLKSIISGHGSSFQIGLYQIGSDWIGCNSCIIIQSQFVHWTNIQSVIQQHNRLMTQCSPYVHVALPFSFHQIWIHIVSTVNRNQYMGNIHKDYICSFEMCFNRQNVRIQKFECQIINRKSNVQCGGERIPTDSMLNVQCSMHGCHFLGECF